MRGFEELQIFVKVFNFVSAIRDLESQVAAHTQVTIWSTFTNIDCHDTHVYVSVQFVKQTISSVHIPCSWEFLKGESFTNFANNDSFVKI